MQGYVTVYFSLMPTQTPQT